MYTTTHVAFQAPHPPEGWQVEEEEEEAQEARPRHRLQEEIVGEDQGGNERGRRRRRQQSGSPRRQEQRQLRAGGGQLQALHRPPLHRGHGQQARLLLAFRSVFLSTRLWRLLQSYHGDEILSQLSQNRRVGSNLIVDVIDQDADELIDGVTSGKYIGVCLFCDGESDLMAAASPHLGERSPGEQVHGQSLLWRQPAPGLVHDEGLCPGRGLPVPLG